MTKNLWHDIETGPRRSRKNQRYSRDTKRINEQIRI